jgi:large subunit ribosomal protein L31e
MSLNETPEESIYTVNFRKAWITPEYKRTNRVVGILKEFTRRHMKTDDIKIDQYLNRYLWQRGKRNPPRKIRVRMTKDESDMVVVSLYEEFKERKSQKGDLEIKQQPETTTEQEQSSKKTKEPGAKEKEEIELEDSVENEEKDTISVESSDDKNKKEPKPKAAAKPKKKPFRKKKSAD